MNPFQQKALFIGVIIFMCLAEGTALFLYAWDSAHNIAVPPAVSNFITMGLTYAVTALTHQQVQTGFMQSSEMAAKSATSNPPAQAV